MKTRKALIAGLLLIVLSACTPATYGVGMQKILSDILFGQPKPPPSPSPAPSPETPLPPITFLPPPSLPEAVDPCPSAPLGTPALKESETNVDAPPTDGVYKWLTSTHYVPAGSVSAVTSGFDTRLIEQSANLGDYPATPAQGQPDHHFQFTEVMPDPYEKGATEVITYQEQTYSPIDYNSASLQNNEDPNGGIAITDIKRFDPKGNLIEEFNPVKNGNGAGVLVFALPLPAGNNGNTDAPTPDAPSTTEFSWEFTSVDPVSQWTIRIAGSEGSHRVRVDACGQIVDGWPVDANVQITKSDPTTHLPYAGPLNQVWHYVVAPQYGGLIVLETISGDAGNGATISISDQIASLDEAPLPPKTGGT